MDDDDNRPPRREGGRNKGPRGAKSDAGQPSDGPRGAKPGSSGKRPFQSGPKRSGDDAKPFRKGPGGDRKSFDGDRKPREARVEGDRPPRRDFERPRADGDGAKRPYKAGPKRDGEAKPFRKGPGGDRKPFDGERKPREARAEGDRPPRRDFDKPRADGEGAKRPYRPGPKRDGEAKPFGTGAGGDRKSFDGDRKPREARAEGDRPPRRDFDRPRADGEGAKRSYSAGPKRDGEAKPFRKGPGGDRKPFDGERKPREARVEGDRPPRRFDDRRPEGDRKPRRDGEGRPPMGAKGDGPRKPRFRDEAAPEAGERIAKRLARAGLSSRRDAEELIAAGRVRVNGVVLDTPARNVGPDDRIEVDEQLIPAIERTRLFLFHKPAGLVTTNRDPEGRKTIFDALPAGLPRLVTVGRLDINTEGLLLLTNDGGLARMLELPATGWLRRYRVRAHGKVDEKQLAGLKDGIAVDGVFYGSVEASLDREQGSNAWLTIGLREGKNREVKNILGALGLEVSRLIRISYGPFQLGELAEGEVQELKGRMLREQLGERLIEEAGANFDAPVVNAFSNKPVRKGRDEPVAGPALKPPVGEGGLIKNRKRDREFKREDALGRLSTTKPARPGGPKGKRDREEKPFEPPRVRSANVWMAPGARPAGKEAGGAKGSSDRKAGDKPRPPRDGVSGDGKGKGGPRADRRR